ncbi:hypothetical protein PUR71_24840 [Streptomyces sp. SP17BM10]|uniref:hypothetical protein n=1 Tax=Streptomyces sp. SP17BM10 TaxID=3002530 RepID=UPI002E7672EC|nr:hypothetical protein [Streptomyces sp. SP17BM10]MEE1786100.1 hypothetical protein [Streptomyces sp. SP17BM10]
MRELHTHPGPRRRTGPRVVALTAMLAAGGVLAAACSSSSTNPSIVRTSGPSPAESAAATQSSSSSSSPSPSATGSSSPGPEAAASSAAAAAAFAASVSAQQAMAHDRAVSALAQAPDGGNAIGSVTITGVPLAATGGLPAVVVTIHNNGLDTASYAVQVDFTDTHGMTVDSSVVGAENLAPDTEASPVAFSSRTDQRLIPVVVKAVRY